MEYTVKGTIGAVIGAAFLDGSIVTEDELKAAGVDTGFLFSLQPPVLVPVGGAPVMADTLADAQGQAIGSDAPQSGTITVTREQIQEALDTHLADAQKTIDGQQKTIDEQEAKIGRQQAAITGLEDINATVRGVADEQKQTLAIQADQIAAQGEEIARLQAAMAASTAASTVPPTPADDASLPIPQPVLDALAATGYDTPEKRAAASDEDLLKVPGVGPATVAKIRAQA